MKTLLIDNYDSFSHILFQYLWEVNGQEPLFIHNDEWTLDRIRQERFDNILISPGPGRPDRVRDFGVCAKVMEEFKHVPLLGVCLGHQGLGLSAGARIVQAPSVRHGKLSNILHNGEGLFSGLPQGFPAMRYHSLVVESTADSGNMRVLATSEEDKQIMAIRLLDRPAFGLQFHPESIGTEGGRLLLANFRNLTLAHGSRQTNLVTTSLPRAINKTVVPVMPSAQHIHNVTGNITSGQPKWIELRELPWRDPEAVFHVLFHADSAAFWLDSANAAGSTVSSYTYMGTGAKLVEVNEDEIRIISVKPDGQAKLRTPLTQGDPLEYLQSYLRNTEASVFPETCAFTGSFRGGLIGYFGYGIKRHTVPGLQSVPSEKNSLSDRSGPRLHADNGNKMPDALFLEPSRVLAFDHAAGIVYAFLPVTSDFQDPEMTAQHQESLTWLENLTSRWNSIQIPALSIQQSGDPTSQPELLKLPWKLSAHQSDYLDQIRNLQSAMLAGESYEACLTNQACVEADIDPWIVYRCLRSINPAPYLAYMRFPQGTLLSASPERFLKVDKAGRLSSRPIKGTRRRGVNADDDKKIARELAANTKDRSENLMIVDLVRNDIGKVSQVGSVRVTESLVVETHPTVLQLVSGVEGKLKPGLDALDAFRACFPGGSMTGAPKRRSMELLDAEERRERGVFSGAMGYLGYDGSMDLGMVIRTLVCHAGTFSVGCGGAILTESDPDMEFKEAMLKAFAPMQALELAIYGECGNWKRGEIV